MGTRLDSGAILKPSGFVEGAEYGRGIKRERGGPMFMVSVTKVGGGTLGKAYDGEWTVTLLRDGVTVYDQKAMRTGTSKTHYDVAQMAVDFATTDEN